MIRTRILVARLSLALLFPVFPGGPAMAADATKQAKQALEKNAGAVLKGFRKEVGLHAKLLAAELDSVDAALANGGSPSGQTGVVFTALETLQSAVAAELKEASSEYRDAMSTTLQALQQAGVGVEDRPGGFFYGDGGISDDLRDDLTKELEKRYAKVEKRLAKTRKAFDARGWSMNYRVEAPSKYLEWAVGPSGAGTMLLDPLAVDIALAFSDRSVSGDARFLIGGGCKTTDGSLTGWVSYPSGGYAATVSVKSGDRWIWSHTGMSEGNYVFTVRVPSAVGSTDGTALGVD